MRRLLLGIAAATASAVIPTASLAVTSGQVSASMAVGYSCDLDLPGNQTLVASGTTATASAAVPYVQNGDTIYGLSSLTLTTPTNSDVSGSISLTAADGTTVLVTNSSTSGSSSGSAYEGSKNESGTIDFTVQENTQSAFIEGSYSISATLSCQESQ
tara:strand:+ start:106 stop:576 length:471 start_codon:yes stop_codon:yes gene_type:complete